MTTNRTTTTPDLQDHTAPDASPYEYAVAWKAEDNSGEWIIEGWYFTIEAAEVEIEVNGGILLAVDDPDDEEGGIQ